MLPKLIYKDVQGKSECIRMLLNHAKVQFIDERLSPKGFLDLKAAGGLPNGQVPIWIDEKGEKNQSEAILRYLGNIHGYDPKGIDEQFEADWLR